MRPWFRILSIAAVAVVGAAVLTAGAPATLAFDEGGAATAKAIKAWEPYGVKHLAIKRSNEGGPVELPRPIEKPELNGAMAPGAQPAAPDSGKTGSFGAIPTGRGASGPFDLQGRAERRIQQVIRRLG